MINRRDVRESVLKAIYALHQSKEPMQHVTDTVLKERIGKDKETRRFGERLFFLTVEHEEDLDSIIENHIRNWEIGRLAMIDRLILEMAICEFLHFEEIPTKVTINEAIEIAKKYSTAKSGNFINGILDAALDQLKKDGRINKKGRGLIEKSINR